MPTTAKKASAEETKPVAKVEEAKAPERDPRACVADDGTPHTGRAVNGKVCSQHANRYRPDGTRR